MDHHGLCDSNKLLYKQCAKSMGRLKFQPPQFPHFSTDLNETWNQERHPGYNPTRKIWLMWDDGKGVCAGRAFSVTFCVLSIFLYSCSRLQVTPENQSRPFMAQNACFHVRCLLGVSMIKNVWGQLPKNIILGGLNRDFKPNLWNFWIAISRKVRTRSTRNSKGEFWVHKWTSWVVQHYKIVIQDGGTNSNNSAADWHRWMKFCRNVDGCYQKWNIWRK